MKLIADEYTIRAEDGEYICTVSMSEEEKAYLNEEYRENGESWIDYRRRTDIPREKAKKERFEFVKSIVDAYNASISDTTHEH